MVTKPDAAYISAPVIVAEELAVSRLAPTK